MCMVSFSFFFLFFWARTHLCFFFFSTAGSLSAQLIHFISRELQLHVHSGIYVPSMSHVGAPVHVFGVREWARAADIWVCGDAIGSRWSSGVLARSGLRGTVALLFLGRNEMDDGWCIDVISCGWIDR